MEPLSTHNLSEICSCLPENCDFLTPYFFHQCHALSGLVWLYRPMTLQLVVSIIFCEQRLLIGI